MKMMCSFERSIHAVLPNRHFVSSLWRNELSESTTCSCFPPAWAQERLSALRPRVGFIPGRNLMCGDCPEVLLQCQESVRNLSKGSLHSLAMTVMRKCARRSGKRWSPTASARTTAKPPLSRPYGLAQRPDSPAGARGRRVARMERVATGSPPRSPPATRVARLARRSRRGRPG